MCTYVRFILGEDIRWFLAQTKLKQNQLRSMKKEEINPWILTLIFFFFFLFIFVPHHISFYQNFIIIITNRGFREEQVVMSNISQRSLDSFSFFLSSVQVFIVPGDIQSSLITPDVAFPIRLLGAYTWSYAVEQSKRRDTSYFPCAYCCFKWLFLSYVFITKAIIIIFSEDGDMDILYLSTNFKCDKCTNKGDLFMFFILLFLWPRLCGPNR